MVVPLPVAVVASGARCRRSTSSRVSKRLAWRGCAGAVGGRAGSAGTRGRRCPGVAARYRLVGMSGRGAAGHGWSTKPTGPSSTGQAQAALAGDPVPVGVAVAGGGGAEPPDRHRRSSARSGPDTGRVPRDTARTGRGAARPWKKGPSAVGVIRPGQGCGGRAASIFESGTAGSETVRVRRPATVCGHRRRGTCSCRVVRVRRALSVTEGRASMRRKAPRANGFETVCTTAGSVVTRRRARTVPPYAQGLGTERLACPGPVRAARDPGGADRPGRLCRSPHRRSHGTAPRRKSGAR